MRFFAPLPARRAILVLLSLAFITSTPPAGARLPKSTMAILGPVRFAKSDAPRTKSDIHLGVLPSFDPSERLVTENPHFLSRTPHYGPFLRSATLSSQRKMWLTHLRRHERVFAALFTSVIAVYTLYGGRSSEERLLGRASR
jgi:hypothetical protein